MVGGLQVPACSAGLANYKTMALRTELQLVPRIRYKNKTCKQALFQALSDPLLLM